MTKHNFYVISGGPGAGKTSLLNFLSSKGYAYIPETAREIIKRRISEGLSPRPDPASFARQMFDKDFENYVSNSDKTSLLFFDRSFIDSAGLLQEADPNRYEQIKTTHLTNRYNQKVFITPPWEEIFCNDAERDQSFRESIEVCDRVCKWYAAYHYELILLPKDTIENRAGFILDHVSD
ncbi:MAG TPA: AAA family ATPase [Puia sp.]|nr:AAA family ATPase [Puia sp.]